MTGNDFGNFAYLILLLIAVGGWALTETRRNWARSFRQFLVWGFIFIGVIAAFGLWNDIRNDIMPRQNLVQSGTVVVPRGPDGHYQLVLKLNGTAIPFLVDTGASDVVLSKRDAERAGIDVSALAFSDNAFTANGVVKTASVTIATIELEDIVDRNMRISINDGEMSDSLLGMAYLSRFEKIEISDNKLILTR